MKNLSLTYILLLPLLLFPLETQACTSLIVSAGASEDGSTMISYAADSHVLYGVLYFYPAEDHPAGSMRQVYDWDSSKYLGEIPEVPHTYKVVGSMNEHQVSIGESTYGGIPQFSEEIYPGSIMDYGSLMWIALQRSKTAREAIKCMADLANAYGYASEGESMSIADKDEVWIMEMIGKGREDKGLSYVAIRIPNGNVSGHANQARIQQFDHTSPDVIFSDDLVSFAKSKGLVPADMPEADFSFSDVYNPVVFDTARGCEARVWSFFHKLTNGGMKEYEQYARGYDLTKRMPLHIKPLVKVTPKLFMDLMRDHFEGEWLEFSSDVGAQAFHMPYRWRPLTWKYGDDEYLNERAISTQQTGFNFVAQARNYISEPLLGGIFWFGVDDTSMSCHVPIYAGLQKCPFSYALGNGAIMEFTFKSAFWVFNLVGNWAYTRYDIIYPDVKAKIDEIENGYIAQIVDVDREAMVRYNQNHQEGIDYVSEFSFNAAEKLVADWFEFFKFLLAKFIDGGVKTANPGHTFPTITFPGYGEDWYQRIVEETGDHYLIPNQTSELYGGGGKLDQMEPKVMQERKSTSKAFERLVRMGKI